GPGRGALGVDADSRAVQGLYRPAQAQHVPVLAHGRDRAPALASAPVLGGKAAAIPVPTTGAPVPVCIRAPCGPRLWPCADASPGACPCQPSALAVGDMLAAAGSNASAGTSRDARAGADTSSAH